VISPVEVAVDIVVALTDVGVDALLRALGPEFHVDEESVRRAVRQRSSVNVFHQPSATESTCLCRAVHRSTRSKWNVVNTCE
jgi:hypothetical protein